MGDTAEQMAKSHGISRQAPARFIEINQGSRQGFADANRQHR
jgi:hypothetical protein